MSVERKERPYTGTRFDSGRRSQLRHVGDASRE
jgi:hypothetical protein